MTQAPPPPAGGDTSASPELQIKGSLRLPPGLKLNLPFYFFRHFFQPGNPILLFEYLQKFGRAAHYRLLWNHIVLLNDPSDIREVLIDKAQFFIKDRTQKRMKILLGEGLITSDGEIHKRHRRIAAPTFHRQRIQGYAETIVAQAAAMRDRWQPDVEIDIAAEMMHLALGITARTLFNTEVTAEIEAINDESNAVMEIYNALISLPRAEALLRWRVPIPALRRFRKSKRRLDSVVDGMIAARQREMADSDARGEEPGTDLLSMLIAARDEEAVAEGRPGLTSAELRDEVMTLFLAGYETVANALSWTWLLLGQNPEAEARLHQELNQVLGDRLPTIEDLPNLKYTEMVLAESMRLYPPAWAMGRQATQEIDIGPYRLPKGCFVFFSQYIVQRSEKYFPSPRHFHPERFTPEAKADRPRFAYFPFGGGGRQCIGESFAWMEATLVLATLAQRWQLNLSQNQRLELQPKITLRPKFGIHVIPEYR